MREGNEGHHTPDRDDDPRRAAGVGEGMPSDSTADPARMGTTLGIEADAAVAAGTVGETKRLAVNVLAGGGVNVIKILLQLVMLPLMAHLLGPVEFGIYALALPTVAFFMTLADGGLGASLARESLDSRDVWSTAFWLIMAVGIGLTVAMTGWGIVLAWLSQEPRVKGVMALLSLSFLFVTISVVPSARLTRDRRLAMISVADLAGNLVGAAVGVALAASGAGAMSLAAQYATLSLVRACVLNAVAFMRPSLVFRISILKSHLSTGSSLMSSRLVEFAGRLVENLVFGRLFGPAALGTYTFANQVPRFVCEAASGPLWGALYAYALREDDEQIRQTHAKLVYLLALLLAPVALLAAATGPGLIYLILGPTWEEAGKVMAVLIPFYALNVIATLSGAVLLARGAGWAIFWLLLFLVVGRTVAVLPGPWVGSVGVAWGIGLAQVVYTVLTLVVLARNGMPSTNRFVRGIRGPFAAALVAGLGCYAVVYSAPTDITRISLALIVGAGIYVLLLILLEGSRLRDDVAGMMRLIRR